MLKTTEKLDKTGDRISQGRAQLAETEARSFVLLLCIPHPHKMAACAVLMSATVRQIHVTRRDRQTEYASSSGNIISWHMFGVHKCHGKVPFCPVASCLVHPEGEMAVRVKFPVYVSALSGKP